MPNGPRTSWQPRTLPAAVCLISVVLFVMVAWSSHSPRTAGGELQPPEQPPPSPAVLATLRADGAPQPPHPLHVLVVLGCWVYPDGTPTPWLQARIDAVAAHYHGLVKEGQQALIMPSGGAVGNSIVESEVIERFLLSQHGVPAADIVTDTHAFDSQSNAENCAMLMSKHPRIVMAPRLRLVIVTNAFHVVRTGLLFAAVLSHPVLDELARKFDRDPSGHTLLDDNNGFVSMNSEQLEAASETIEAKDGTSSNPFAPIFRIIGAPDGLSGEAKEERRLKELKHIRRQLPGALEWDGERRTKPPGYPDADAMALFQKIAREERGETSPTVSPQSAES